MNQAFLAGFVDELVKIAETQKCLRRTLILIKRDPSLKLMIGPPDKTYDTRHFWAETRGGQIIDPTRKDYPHYDRGKPLDLSKNPGLLKTSAMERVTTMDARSITPLHGVTDRAKLRALKADMRRRGWVGDPVVVLNESRPKGVTGSHRVAAAAGLGMRIPVIAVDPKSGLRRWRTGDDDAAMLRHLRSTPMAARAFERGMPKTAKASEFGWSPSGKKFSVPRLWEETAEQQAVQTPVADLVPLIRERMWKNRDGGKTPALESRNPFHLRKMRKADLRHPVILHPDGWVMDGAHRIVKAHRLGVKSLPVRTAKKID